MPAVDLLDLPIDVPQIFLLRAEKLLGFFVTRPSSVIETGRMMIAISVISGEMLSIIINTPIMVAVAVMMVVMLWFKPCPSVSTSLVIRESTSP